MKGTPSTLARAPTGIAGFDILTSGGTPRGRTTLLMGGPGCGKSIFALQTLVEGARRFKEPGIFVAFEEHERQILANVEVFGWDLPALRRKRLFFIDAHLPTSTIVAGTFDLAGLLAGLSVKTKQMGARRIVFDGIDVLLSQLEDAAAERREVLRLYEWLGKSGLTATVTAKIEGPDPSVSPRYGFLQYLADCVVALNHRLANGIALRHLRVLKYRGSSTSSNEIPILLSSNGVEVGAFAKAALEHPVSTRKVTSGIQRLDAMLGGGYFRGTCVLVSGAPGTAKSTLAGAFADAACVRGEKTLFVSFDESGDQIIRNLHSVGIRLEKHVESGVLHMHSMRASSSGSEEHLLRILAIIRKDRIRCLVVDPLSALPRAIGTVEAHASVERLINLVKTEGVTLVATSLLDGSDPLLESTVVGVSTCADTWIHLSYVIQGGERNRALTIVKSRGMGHSNQVRELLLGDRGITLADVYSARGVVLMGTLRAEKEERDRMDRVSERRAADARLRDLDASITETSGRMAALNAEIEGKVRELSGLKAERSTDIATARERLTERRSLRGADVTSLRARRPSGRRSRRG